METMNEQKLTYAMQKIEGLKKSKRTIKDYPLEYIRSWTNQRMNILVHNDGSIEFGAFSTSFYFNYFTYKKFNEIVDREIEFYQLMIKEIEQA